MINQLLHHLWVASLCTSIFCLIFISLRKLIIKSIGTQWNYYLWFTIFIPWFAVWLPFNFLSDMNFNLDVTRNTVNTQQMAHAIPIIAKIDWPTILFSFWLSGMFFYALLMIIRHFKFISVLNKNSHPLTVDQIKLIKNSLTNKKLIPLDRIFISGKIISPLICHIFKSKIYLPTRFLQDYTSAEQKYVLEHEDIHYHRCDLIANTAMLILSCINWFNPIIWFSYRYFRINQELSCDAIVSQQYSAAEKKAYGYALLKASGNEVKNMSAMNCWWNSDNQLKERFAMLKYHQTKPLKNLFGLITLSILTSIAIAAPNIDKYNLGMNISNSSKNPLTFSIGGVCSKEIGVIKAHSVTVISREKITNACYKNLTSCKTEVYATADCSGNSITTLTLNVTGWGVISIAPPFSDSYEIGANGFNLFFRGPWI